MNFSVVLFYENKISSMCKQVLIHIQSCFRVETTCDDDMHFVLDQRQKIGHIKSDISRNGQIILLDAVVKNFPKKR